MAWHLWVNCVPGPPDRTCRRETDEPVLVGGTVAGTRMLMFARHDLESVAA